MSTVLNSSNLTGRVAVITGASSGMGAASAKTLAAQGAKVALLARRKERLDELAAQIISAGGTALVIVTDVTDQASVEAAARQVKEQFGNADLVLNNAGIMLPAPIEELHTDQWQHQIDLNITSVMHTIGAFVPQLTAAAAAGRTADLINMSSVAAQYLFPNFAVYSGTKAFVSHLSRHMRLELGPKDIRVTILEPGVVSTELQGHVTDAGASAWLKDAARTMELLQPEDVAQVVAFTAALPRHVNLQQVTIMPTREG